MSRRAEAAWANPWQQSSESRVFARLRPGSLAFARQKSGGKSALETRLRLSNRSRGFRRVERIVPVVQITYDVPLDIAKGLATGELSMLGTAAVRNSKHIAAHIREVSRTISDGDEPVAAAMAKGAKNPTFVVIGIGVVAVAAVGGVAVWARSKKKQSAAEYETPECVRNYNASLGAYLEAIGSGSLESGLIDRLIADLDVLKQNADSGSISLELSLDESDKLVHIIADYTSKLAEANSVELSGLDDEADDDSADGGIVDMRRYLEAQRQIFDESA